MKKSLLLVGSLLLIASIALIGCSSGPSLRDSVPPVFSTLAAGNDAAKTGLIWSQQSVGIWVNGEGKASGTPDIAILSLGVDVQQSTVAAAQRDAADAMDKIIKALKGKNVADKDIQTQQYSIQIVKRYIEKENREEIIGYQITNTVTAKIRKVTEAGNVIDSVATAGGNATRINDISFSVDDPAPYYKEARDKAVADAMAKAKQIAGAVGVKLGKPNYINESIAYVPQPMVRSLMKADASAPAAPTPISAGELEFRINIQIVYGIE
jgi:uncharacterized protein YggE